MLYSAVQYMTMKSKEKVRGARAVTVYLPVEIHREVQKAAKQGRRSMSAQIVTIVEGIVKEPTA